MVRHHTLAPIGKESSQTEEEKKRAGSRSPEPKKDAKEPVETDRARESIINNKGFRRDERGRAKKGREFSDQPILGEQKAKIVSLRIWTLDNKMGGIQAIYQLGDGSTLEGGQHVANNPGQPLVFETEKGDFIKEISGFIDRTEGAIECLIITSFSGESKRIGEPKKTSKLFKFDINELEYPACIYGTLKGKLIENNYLIFLDEQGQPSVLSKLGVLIAVDEPVEEKIGEAQEEGRHEEVENTNGKRSPDQSPKH